MKTNLAVIRELNRLARRIDHLNDRISKKKKSGECYSDLYSEREQAIGRKESLIWVKNG